MSLLITGGTGFFGRALIRHFAGLRQRPFERIIILTRNPSRFKEQYPSLGCLPWLDWWRGDVLNFDSLPHGVDFKYILHAATDSTDVSSLTPLQRYHQIVRGTENLLRFSVQNKTRRFLLTSSGGCYGSQPSHMACIPETYLGIPDPLSHHSAYGMAKREAEHLCTLYSHAHGLEVVIARCFAFVGIDLPINAHFAIGNFIRDALWADEILVQGDGTPLRTYLDQRDLVHWLIRLLIDGRSGEAYNVGSDEVISILELANLIQEIVSPGKFVRVLGDCRINLERSKYIPDITKISSDLNLTPKLRLRQSILDVATARREQKPSY